MHAFIASIQGKILALLLVTAIALLGCELGRPLAPNAGRLEYQQPGFVAVPGGAVNAAGGNLVIERADLSVDTLLGTAPIRGVYNSASGGWHWSHQLHFDGSVFTDPSGATHDVAMLAAGAAVAGTIWLKTDDDTVSTKGGLAYDFGPDGSLAAVHWATLPYPRLRYARSDGLLEVEQCAAPPACTAVHRLEVDAAGRPLAALELRSGRSAEFDYDGLGRLSSVRSAADLERGRPGTRYEYIGFGGLLASLTNSEGERVEYRYADGRVHAVVQVGEGDPRHRFYYSVKNAFGLYATLHINPLGGVTRYAFDGLRRLHRRTRDDSGERLEFTWDAAAGLRPLRELVPSGAEIHYAYAGDDLVGIVEPSGNAIGIEYAPGALNTDAPERRAIARAVDDFGVVHERSYDALGRWVTSTNGAGEVMGAFWGPATLQALASPGGMVRSFPHYGAHGHWTTVEGAATDHRSFDLVGNPTLPTTPERIGGVLARRYDGDRNLVGVDLAETAAGRVIAESAVAIDRRSDGRMNAVTRPGGGDHEFVRDALGRIRELRERVDGVWQVTRFEHDAAGNVVARTRPNGMRQEYSYDRYGRLAATKALRDGVLESANAFVFTAGLLVSVLDPIRGTIEAYGYDAAGRRVLTVHPDGESVAVVFDARSRVVSETYALPDQGALLTLEHVYDGADRRIRTATGAGEILIEREWRDGRLLWTGTGNGLTRSIGYDPDSGSMATTTTVDSQGELVEATTVSRRFSTAPARQEVRSRTETSLGATEEQYWLGVSGSLQDPDQRVGKRVFAWNDGNGDSRVYAWDVLSNAVDDADGDVFVYNEEGNRLQSAQLAADGLSVTYTWDEAGFATSRDGVPIEWTATGRLAAYGPVELEWDLLDRLATSSLGGTLTRVYRFGGRVACDPVTGAVGALDLGEVEVAFGSGERRYRHLDFRGNVSFVSDASGVVENHYGYDPFGMRTALGSGNDSRTFVSQAGFGPFLLLGARMYDPQVGRFLSPDPVFDLFDQYGYAHGNPVWFSDPDGRHQTQLPGGYTTEDIELSLAIGATLLAVYVWYVPAAAPQAAILISSLYLMLKIAEWSTSDTGGTTGAGSGTSTGSLGSGQAPGAIGAGALAAMTVMTCAPTALARAPRSSGLLQWMWSLQLLLGLLVLRNRRRAPGGAAC